MKSPYALMQYGITIYPLCPQNIKFNKLSLNFPIRFARLQLHMYSIQSAT